MVKVVIDIPKEKMPSFLNMIVSLGIDNHAILSQPTSPNKGKPKAINPLRSFKKFLLFDWEFFNNELEFE